MPILLDCNAVVCNHRVYALASELAPRIQSKGSVVFKRQKTTASFGVADSWDGVVVSF